MISHIPGQSHGPVSVPTAFDIVIRPHLDAKPFLSSYAVMILRTHQDPDRTRLCVYRCENAMITSGL
jgi:hypothetical protein